MVLFFWHAASPECATPHMSKETCIYENRSAHVKKSLHIRQETYLYGKTPICLKKNYFCVSVSLKEKLICYCVIWFDFYGTHHLPKAQRHTRAKRLTCMKRDLHISKQTYRYKKWLRNRPIFYFLARFFFEAYVISQMHNATYVKKDLHAGKETYLNKKRPVKDTNSQILFG